MWRVFLIYWRKYTGVRKILSISRFLNDRPKLRQYLLNLRDFESQGGIIDKWSIHLHEDSDFAGAASGHYFWQDLVVAQWVLAQKKSKIVDVGSRLDGYVAHVAASRKLSVIDIRPIKKLIPNVEFIQADILNFKGSRKFEIVTSLHTLEHIGLGRYGDPIDPEGHIRCFESLAKLVFPKGHLVVSFPIDSETRVEFNGQRLIGVLEPLLWAERNKLKFTSFMYLDSDDKFLDISKDSELANFDPNRGSLGIYFFRKTS